MSQFKLIIYSLVLCGLANGDHPLSWKRDFEESFHLTSDVSFRNDEQVYRLPENVIPLEYDIYIDLYFAERADRPYSFDGREYIIIQAIEDNVNQVVLHANVDTINSISILTSSGNPVPLNVTRPFELERQYHFLKINTAAALTAGVNYTLFIDYSNTMNEGPMKRGIWRGYYTDGNGVERIYATTHFQPYNARQAFPCWDEPLFKAVFQVHLSRPSSYTGVFSNTGIATVQLLGNGRVQSDFFATPKMSSYLVTFLVSETFQVIAEDRTFNPPIRIIGRSNTVGLGEHALELSVKMTEYFDEYFQIPYSSLHPRLLNDHVSSPDWASGGTENWGMVSYREMYLTLDPSETIMSVEHYAATLVSHELAHKWFGNLITCYWWSNTWINEGFASYFGYIAAHEMFPQYELHEHFNSRYMHSSLSFDSGTTVPLNHEVNTPAQVTGHFGTISYSKGAAFLRMTADIISLETFRKACHYFLIDNAYEPTNQTHLYNAFIQAIREDNSLVEYPLFNFYDYYTTWVNEPGFPILNVNVNHGTGEISLSQERFFLSATATPTGQIYPIPITYSTKSDPNFTNLKPITMMTEANAILRKNPGEEWVIFNNLQHGHYRVNYDERTWNLIREALLDEPETIHYLNRAQIVDDIFALIRSGRMTYSFGFRMLSFLRNEVNYHVWDAAITGFTWIRNRFRQLPATQAAFDEYVLSYMQQAIDSVGYTVSPTESPTTNMLRQDLLHFACTLKHEACVEQSRTMFVNMRDTGVAVNSRIRRNVYVVGVREGGQQDYQFLLNRFQQSNFANDQLEMLRALAATKDPQLVNQYLQMTLTNAVRSHDKVNSFNYALLGNPENAYTVLQFVMNNIDAIRVAYVEDAPPNPVHTALSNLALYLDEPALVEFEDWLRTSQTNLPQFNTAISAITSARSNIAWGNANADTILAAARDGAVTNIVSLTVLVTMAIVAVNA